MNLFSKHAPAVVFAAAISFALPAVAQTEAAPPPPPPTQTDTPPPPPGYGGPRPRGPEHRLEMMQRALNLTPDQTTQVKAIYDAERTKMEALRSNTSLAPEDRHSQMMTIRQDTSTKVRAVLTADQATKYDQIQSRMREHGPGAGAPPPPPLSGPAGPQ